MNIYDYKGIPIQIGGGSLSDEAKAALLACFNNVALWKDGNGELYISTLEAALNQSQSTYPRIIALYDTTHTAIIGEDVNSLKQYLVVTYYESETSPGVIIQSNNYTLSGLISAKQNTITATYNNCSAQFVVHAVDMFDVYKWEYPNNSMIKSVIGVNSENANIAIFNDRRALYMVSGISGAKITYTTGNEINNGKAFLLPVPNDVTKIRATITPSTWQIACASYYLNDNNNRVYAADTGGWQTGVANISITARPNTLLQVSYRYGSSDLTNIDASKILIEYL